MPAVMWKDVVGYEGRYKVSSDGGVRSIGRYKEAGNQFKKFNYWVIGKELRLSQDKDGYKVVSLGKDGERVTKKVHRLVSEAFIPNHESYPAVNHLDSDRANNSLCNLEWCTNKMNSAHASKSGNVLKGESHSKVRLGLVEFKFLKLWVDRGYSSKELQRAFDVSKSIISAVKHNKHWSTKEESLCQA